MTILFAALMVRHAGMRRVMEAEALGVVMLLAPGDCLAVYVNADIGAGETAPAEIKVAQPMRPAATSRSNVEDIRAGGREPLREDEHPEVAGVGEEVNLVVHDPVADADPHAEVIGRQVAELGPDQPG